jgi:hypothetical protein
MYLCCNSVGNASRNSISKKVTAPEITFPVVIVYAELITETVYLASVCQWAVSYKTNAFRREGNAKTRTLKMGEA